LIPLNQKNQSVEKVLETALFVGGFRWDWNAEETQQTTERELSYDPQGFGLGPWGVENMAGSR
jgi:hypothetical protein